MQYKAIIFDLYGTLVGNFSRKVYDQVQAEMANVLNVTFHEFWKIKAVTIKDRTLGNLTFEENIVEIGRRLDVKIDRSQIEQIAALGNEFTRKSLIPKPKIIEGLAKLKRTGLHLGLITNCNSSVPLFFPQTELAQYIDSPVYSCQERIMKPSHGIYEIACKRLKVMPRECIYVGDGSSEELTGTAEVGMFPILKRTDLADVYDPHRSDVENWQGPTIDDISELYGIVSELS